MMTDATEPPPTARAAEPWHYVPDVLLAYEPLFYIEPASLAPWQVLCKRAMDVIGAGVGLLNNWASSQQTQQQPFAYQPQQSGWLMAYTSGLFGLKYEDRLALEMALHEDVEMRALQGELHTLERAWRDAEEIAAIADGILTPSPMQSALNRLRRIGQ